MNLVGLVLVLVSDKSRCCSALVLTSTFSSKNVKILVLRKGKTLRIPQRVVTPRPKLSHNNTAQHPPEQDLDRSCGLLILMIRQFNTLRDLRHVRDTLQKALKNSRLYNSLRDRLNRSIRNNSSNLLKVWAHQCECVAVQRLRRGQQMFCLYSRIWEEWALREFLRGIRRRIMCRTKELAMGAVGLSMYDWQKNKITDAEMNKHIDEMKYVCKLREKTMCQSCQAGKSINPDCSKKVCNCEKWDHSSKMKASYDDWKLFIEKNDMIVWRRIHKSGSYEYKVYGSYPDVSAEDFLSVQVDTKYRNQWDNTAVQLDLLESDPDSNSDVIYWEMLWPRLFSNRDYVFHRRFMIEYKSKTVILLSKSTEHPAVPKMDSKYRITDYWSYMVIKPYTELNKPGIEFSLTYFDNPGVNIPPSVTAWVAMRAMPDFLERLRAATLKYRLYCKQAGISCICNMTDDPLKDLTPIEDRSTLKWQLCNDEDIITDNTIFEAQYNIRARPECSDGGKPTDGPPLLEMEKEPCIVPQEVSDSSKNKNKARKIKKNLPPDEPSEGKTSQEQRAIKDSSEMTVEVQNTSNTNSAQESEQRTSKSIWRFFRPTYYFS